MEIIDIRLVRCVFADNEIINHSRLQRARPKQSDQRDEIVELIRPHSFNEVPHAAGLKLEHRRGVRALEQLECLGVVFRYALD